MPRLQLRAHASCLDPRKTRSSSSWRPSCSRKETSLLYVLSVEWISFLFCLLWFCYLLPVVSLADLHDVYSEGQSCFCTQWCSPQILFLCQWVCSCSLRTCWRCSILIFFIFSDGLLLMETTRLVVAVTQHVVLKVELLLLPLVVSSCFKIAFDISSSVLNFYLFRHSVGRQGPTQSCNCSWATEDFSWVSINGKNLFLLLVWILVLPILIWVL